jgi:hypothetical protein
MEVAQLMLSLIHSWGKLTQNKEKEGMFGTELKVEWRDFMVFKRNRWNLWNMKFS